MNPSRSNSGTGNLRRVSVFLLTGAFLVSSVSPLLASPPQSTPTQSTPTQSTPPQSAPNPSIQLAPDESKPLPDAPQAQSAQKPTDQQPAVAPSGAAGAKAAVVKGTPVAQPTGAAVAPPRQRGHRSLIIKIGLIAGAGVAVGTAVALSAKSPARPPGASALSHP